MVSPWKSFAKPDTEATYVAMLTHLRLGRFSQIPRFVSYSLGIQGQLARTAGLIGYAIKANPLRNRFWTLSVWTHDRALLDFVRSEPHRSSMSAFDKGTVTFTRWQVAGSEIPPQWDDAMRRHQEDQNG